MEEAMERLLAEAPPSPPPTGEYRARGERAPAPPRTLRELYDGRREVIRSGKWREQLLDRPAHKRRSDTDVAEMVLSLEEGKLTTMLVFDGKPTTCYVADETSGVWRRTEGPKYHEAYDALAKLSDRMDAVVMEPLKAMIRRQKAELSRRLEEGTATPSELEQLQTDRQASEEHMLELVALYERLRKVSHQQAIMERIITKRLVQTREEGVSESALDTAKDCIAFEDGVYSFR
jgi:hypothetical protein